MSQILPIWENCLVVFVCPRISYEILRLKSSLKSIMLKKIEKINGLPKLASCPPLGGRPDKNSGRPWNLIHSPPCRTPCRLFIHEFFGPLGLQIRVWSELGQSPPFRPMRALRLQWSWAFNLVCEVALTFGLSQYHGHGIWLVCEVALRMKANSTLPCRRI